MINTQQLQTIGNQVAEKIESKYPSLIIHFSANPVPDKAATFVEVLIGTKEGGLEKLFQFGVIEHSTAPNAFRFERVFEKEITACTHQFLGIG